MKRRFFGTIRKRMIFMQVVLLVVIMGIICGAFVLYADAYYYNRKLAAMESYFEQLKSVDIGKISNTDELIMRMEDQRLRVIISDENFNCIYISNIVNSPERQQAKVHNVIAKRADRFTPVLKKRNGNGKIRGFGYINQNEHKYYVYIYERKLNTKIHFSYYKLFFGIICVAALSVGIIVSWLISNRIGKPIKRLEQATENAVENGFEVSVDEVQEFNELEGLAKSINIMLTRIRQQMKELEDELVHKSMVEERRRNFVNNVSHELKTPLAIISSQVEMLQLIEDDEKRKEYCISIVEETRSMANLINDMMSVYSTQNGEKLVEIKNIDIGQIVERICLKYKDLFANETITLHEHYEGKCFAMADERYIEQAVGNYITNSIKHSDENGNVYVRVMHKDNFIRIEVENEGKNIPEEMKDKIWDMFYRGDSTANLQGQKGSGLGLYIVKSIVMLHNGCYGFENMEKGVVFWMEIPCSIDD